MNIHRIVLGAACLGALALAGCATPPPAGPSHMALPGTGMSFDRFRADERAYLAEWPMTTPQRDAVLARDYNEMIAHGGNIYFLAKLFSCDGRSFQQTAASMTGMSQQEYADMMLNGGRSPEGNRYTWEQEQR